MRNQATQIQNGENRIHVVKIEMKSITLHEHNLQSVQLTNHQSAHTGRAAQGKKACHSIISAGKI